MAFKFISTRHGEKKLYQNSDENSKMKSYEKVEIMR